MKPNRRRDLHRALDADLKAMFSALERRPPPQALVDVLGRLSAPEAEAPSDGREAA